MTGCSEPYESDVPESVIRQNTLGTAYLGQQEWGSAADSFRGALVERADDPLLLSNLAVALMQAGKPDEAETHLRAAIAADPGHAYAHYNLGLIETNRGNFDAAAKPLRSRRRVRSGATCRPYTISVGRTPAWSAMEKRSKRCVVRSTSIRIMSRAFTHSVAGS